MLRLPKYKIILYLSYITAITSLISNIDLLSLPNSVILTLSGTTLLLVNFAQRIIHQEGKTNQKEYLLESSKQLTELILLSVAFVYYNNFAPTELFYLSLITASGIYLFKTNKERIIGERKELKTTYNQRLTIIILGIGLKPWMPSLGFYPVLIYIIIQFYELYNIFKDS